LRLERSRVQLPAVPLSGNELGQVVHTHVPVTKQYNMVPVVGQRCPATGKVTIGLLSPWPCVTDLWFIHVRARSLSKGDEHPTNSPHGIWYSFMVTLCNRADHIYFHPVICSFFFLSFFSSPNLSHHRLDVCHTSTHGVCEFQMQV